MITNRARPAAAVTRRGGTEGGPIGHIRRFDHVGITVADLAAAVAELGRDGYGLVGGIGQYESSVRMAYVRGPEGIIVSLFEQMAPATG